MRRYNKPPKPSPKPSQMINYFICLAADTQLWLPEMVLDALEAGDRLSEAMLLDPRTENGELAVGGWAEADGRTGEVLARLTLRTLDGEGGDAIRLSSAELTTAEGAAYEVRAEGEVISPPPVAGLRIWLPFARR